MKVSRRDEDRLIQYLRRDRQPCLVIETIPSRDDGSVLVYRENIAEFLHRRLYRILIDPDLGRRYLKRRCATRGCLNPYHYRIAAGRAPGSRDTCPHGHPYTPATTSPDGHCALCTATRRTPGPRKPVGIAAINAAKTTCPAGHPYDEANTFRFIDSRGRTRRKCRTCNRELARQRRANTTTEHPPQQD